MKDQTAVTIRKTRKAILEALDSISTIKDIELSGRDSNQIFSAKTDLLAAKRKINEVLQEG